jgi:NAD(P)-dependent dehydrogenase (short-subunit alcohol dehydrogenase family)
MFSGPSVIQHLVARENVVVFAGARDPTKATALTDLAVQHKGKLYVVKLTSASETDNRAAVEEIKRIVGRLDVVVANAGIASDNKIVAEASQENMLTHFTVNVLGPMVLF